MKIQNEPDITQQDIINSYLPVNKEGLKKLNRRQLEELFLGEQNLRLRAFKDLERMYETEGQYIILKRHVFCPKTEKFEKKKNKKKKISKNKTGKKKKLLPSERYPNAEIIEHDAEIQGEVICDCCGHKMIDSQLRDSTETLKVIPKKYIIEKINYPKFKCVGCDYIKTTPRRPRIKPGSSYSDDMIIDVSMSKYCDLIPMERYAAMASREGFKGLPPNSLIELTHYLANFIKPIIEKIKLEVINNKIIMADETPQRMLEQENKKKQWYLWGFSTLTSAIFECHSSRSGDIIVDFLENSNCHFLVSDAYAGYSKAIRVINEKRKKNEDIKSLIREVLCNAHARRKFKEIDENPEAMFFIQCYKRIYGLEKKYQKDKKNKIKNKNRYRFWQRFYFKIMKKKANNIKKVYSSKSMLYIASNYFLKNYDGLIIFTTHKNLPIDNNHQERLLRSPVVGRKTWYGTHSILGGQTASSLFSLVESCKLNKINPRVYLREIVKRMHRKENILTPFEMKKDFPQIFFLS